MNIKSLPKFFFKWSNYSFYVYQIIHISFFVVIDWSAVLQNVFLQHPAAPGPRFLSDLYTALNCSQQNKKIFCILLGLC